MNRTDTVTAEANRRADAALAARTLVEGLSRDITDRAPVAIARRSRPLWARLTRRSDPFTVSRAQVDQWLAGIEARHPPLTVTAQTAGASRLTARAQDSQVA